MKLNLARLNSIAITLDAIEKMERLIYIYSEDKPGPAYLLAKPVGQSSVELQIDRKLMVETLKAQIMSHVKHLEERFEGFEYDPEAKWHGDEK